MPRLFTSRIVSRLDAILLVVAVTLLTCSASQPSFAQTPSVPNADRLTPSELEELLGPIALYPDPLLANVLAASVYPDEVAEAAKVVASGGSNAQIDAKPWEDPVKAVAGIPAAIKMMGDYPDWTIALGQAYLTQAKDVMDVVQTLRKKAQDNGSLITTPEQKVVVEQKVIYIQPADPQIIYVPTYQPTVVYAAPSNDAVVAGVIGFGVGIAAGLIIANNMDCHWHSGYVGWGHYGGYYGGYHGGGHNDVNINRNVNISGDVNIGNTNIQGGDRNTTIKGGDKTNISGGDRTNVKGGDRVASKDRVGNEGNAWAPDRSKNLATSKPSEAGKLKSGGSNRMAMPDSGSRNPSGNRPGTSGGAKPSQLPAAKPGAGQGAAQGGARPSQQPAAKSKVPASRPPAASQRPAGGGASASQRPSGGGGGASQRQTPSKPSAFEGGSNTKKDSARGSSSRSSSANRSSSGATHSGGGAKSSGSGSRSGGGRR